MTTPRVEIWTEVRCCACVQCGWYTSQLLFKVHGVIPASDAKLQIRCTKCGSIVAWIIGTPRLMVEVYGPKNHRPAKSAFE